jgi:hypothetical protein
MTRTKTTSVMIASAIGFLTGGAFVAGMAVAKSAAKEPVVTPLAEQKWNPMMKEGPLPAMAAIQGDPMKGAYFAYLKLPNNFTSPPHAHSSDYWAVLVQGKMAHWPAAGGSEATAKPMGVGDSIFMPAKVEHVSKCYPGPDCIVALVQKGKNDFIPGKTPAAPAAAPASAPPAAAPAHPPAAPGAPAAPKPAK